MRIGAFEAKNKLGQLLDAVEHGEEIVITRRGKEVARPGARAADPQPGGSPRRRGAHPRPRGEAENWAASIGPSGSPTATKDGREPGAGQFGPARLDFRQTRPTAAIRRVFDRVADGRRHRAGPLAAGGLRNSLTVAVRRGRIDVEFRQAALADLAVLRHHRGPAHRRPRPGRDAGARRPVPADASMTRRTWSWPRRRGLPFATLERRAARRRARWRRPARCPIDHTLPAKIPLAQPPPACVSMTVVTQATLPTAPADRFASIIDGLCRAVAARGGGRDRLAGPLVILIWSRLRRIAVRFAALAARIAAGRQRRILSRRPPRPAPRRPAQRTAAERPCLAAAAGAAGERLRVAVAVPAGGPRVCRPGGRGAADAPPAPPALPDAGGRVPAAAPGRSGAAGCRHRGDAAADLSRRTPVATARPAAPSRPARHPGRPATAAATGLSAERSSVSRMFRLRNELPPPAQSPPSGGSRVCA